MNRPHTCRSRLGCTKHACPGPTSMDSAGPPWAYMHSHGSRHGHGHGCAWPAGHICRADAKGMPGLCAWAFPCTCNIPLARPTTRPTKTTVHVVRKQVARAHLTMLISYTRGPATLLSCTCPQAGARALFYHACTQAGSATLAPTPPLQLRHRLLHSLRASRRRMRAAGHPDSRWPRAGGRGRAGRRAGRRRGPRGARRGT